MIHVAKWIFSDGPRGPLRFAARTPYNPAFVAALKREVPSAKRAWLVEPKIWLVTPDLEQYLRDLLLVCYRDEAVCACWDGETCDVWRTIHFESIGTGIGGIEARRRPPPLPPLPALPADQAARVLLGLGAMATAEEIKSAARRLARAAHPDQGGDHERMVAVLAARDLLLRAGK